MPKLPSPSTTDLHLPVGRPDTLLKRADAAHASGRVDEAIALLCRVLDIDPLHEEAARSLGMVYYHAKQIPNAIQQLEQALRLDPGRQITWIYLGMALSDMGRLRDALVCFDRAIELGGDRVLGLFCRAAALFRISRFAEALACWDQVRRLAPGDPTVANNRAVALQACRMMDDAVAEFDRATALDPHYAWAWFNKAMHFMMRGQLSRGLELYEWRWEIAEAKSVRRQFAQPAWSGEAELRGKTILLWHEQGLGDTLQFCRYGILAARAGARVILDVPESLARLMRTLPGVSEVIVSGTELPEFDLQCPMMSLPLAFGTTLDTIPAFPRYLSAEPELSEQWQHRLAFLSGRRIGLVWAGNSRIGNADLTATDQRRSVTLATLAPLAGVQGCEFVSLQLGPSALQAATLPPGMAVHSFAELLKDFADTAALVENLDLVITVDTSVAHLAGALGRPVWLLNRFDTCWRWMLDRDDSPWYPGLRQFRQTAPGDWEGVIATVAEALGQFVGG